MEWQPDMKKIWHWFYAELPAYYSIPIIAFVIAAVAGMFT